MRKTLLLLIVGNCFFLPSVSHAQKSVMTDSTTAAKFLLIRPSRAMESRLTKPNGVFLITDVKEIEKMQDLFHENNAFSHHCGSQWYVDFFKNALELTDEIPFNTECEKFERNTKQIISLVKNYTSRLENTPPQYLYNLKVSASITPDSIEKKMGKEQNIFFLQGSFQHLPWVTFRMTQTSLLPKDRSDAAKMEVQNKVIGKAKMMQLVAKTDSLFKIVHVGGVTNPVSGVSETEIEDVFEVMLKCPIDVKMDDLTKFITENGGNIQDKRTPEFYFVQLVSPQKMVSIVRDAIQQKYAFVREIFEFPNRK